MLGKVLKYDLKSMGKSLIPLYLALVIMGIVIRCMGILADNFKILDFINNLMIMLFVFLIIGCVFYTLFVAVRRFYKNLFSDEGYLTHTLPVAPNTHLLSKLISGTIYICVSSIVMVLSIVIAFDVSSLVDMINQLISQLSFVLQVSNTAVYIGLGLFMLIGYMSYLLLIFAGICLGQIHNTNKIVFSVVYSVILYYVGQILSVIFLVIMALINPDFINSLDQTVPSKDVIMSVVSFAFIANIVLMVIYYTICNMRVKRLNLS